jgi:hypothetical protein
MTPEPSPGTAELCPAGARSSLGHKGHMADSKTAPDHLGCDCQHLAFISCLLQGLRQSSWQSMGRGSSYPHFMAEKDEAFTMELL